MVLDKDKLFIIGTIQDITQNKTLEIQKLQIEKLLYEQNKTLIINDMIENTVNQWKKALAEISNLTKQEELKSIDYTIQKFSTIIEDTRSFSNPNNNGISEFYISDILTKILNIIDVQFLNKDIEIIKNIEEYKIFSKENELIQVLINIINNAKTTLIAKRNQRKLIFINTYTKDEILFIEIKNNAGGIEGNLIDNIFKPYSSLKYKSEKKYNNLHLSKEIIEKNLKGTISVSNENCTYDDIYYFGSKFTIKLNSI